MIGLENMDVKLKFVVIIAIVASIGLIGFTIVWAVPTPTISLSNLTPQPAAINLSDSSNADRMSVVKVNGTNIHVVWLDSTNQDILYKRSTDSGATFGSTVTVGDGTGYWLSTSPVDMDVVGTKVYIVWATSNEGSANGIKFSKSTDNGATFSSPVNISAGERPKISADGDNVNIIGWGYTSNDNIKLVRSTNSGGTFSSFITVGVGGIVSDIDSQGDYLYIVARTGSDTIKIHRSTNGGSTFSSATLTTCSDFPSIEYTSTNIHFSCGYGSLMYQYSNDNGETWSGALSISSDYAPVAPSISNGTNIVMMWRHHGHASNGAQIWFSSSSDNGLTFGTPSKIDGLGKNYNSQEPSIHADDSLIAATFTACTNNLSSNICNIFFTKSTDGGTTFTPPGGSSTISHVIGSNTNEQIFNATNIANSVIDIPSISPSNDYTIITRNLNVTIPASTTPTDTSHSQLTIKNSTRSINTVSNPSASVVGTIQELGYTNSTSISFDKMVKLTFEGTTGSTPFFINATDTYTINSCSGTPATASQAASDSTITSGARECYWTASNATKFVWTYHFTAFGTGNNFGSSTSSSSSSSSSSGGGKSTCDSKGFGVGQSLRVYEISYDIATNEVQTIAYSTCSKVKVELISDSGRQILGLSEIQPFLEEKRVVYSGILPRDSNSFTILVTNERNEFSEKFFIKGDSVLKQYSGETGYTSAQQGAIPIQKQVPDWVKNNAKWWSEGQVDDSTFTQGIGYLIKEKIIGIDSLPEQASDVAEQKVPDWIRNNAKWWADGMISEDDFMMGIKYLVEQGIIQV